MHKQRGFWNFAIPAFTAFAGGILANESNEDIAENATSANMAEAQRNRDFQADQLRQQREFSSAQAAEQMAYQTEMSNTSYQRAVKDLKQAGLNPMLSLMRGGASTPAGAMGSSAAASGSQGSAVAYNARDVLSPAVASALQARQANAQIENLEAQNDLIKAQRDKTSQETLNLGTEVQNIVATNDQIRATVREIQARERLADQNAEKLVQDVKESFSREDLNRAVEALRKADLAEAKAAEKFFQSEFGTANPVVRQILEILKVVISARRVAKE